MTRTLDDVRRDFDAVDAALLSLLGRRQALAREAAQLKQRAQLPTRDLAREAAARAARHVVADAAGLDRAFVDDVFAVIIAGSVAAQDAARAHEAAPERDG